MEFRYIKLGDRGKWESICLFEEHSIRLGYESNQHQECLRKEWGKVREFWRKVRKSESTVTSDIRQIQDFYELPEDIVWVTFHKGLMYWCRADENVEEIEGGVRRRIAIGGWSCVDAHGRELTFDRLDGRITQKQSYQGTICRIDQANYLERKLSGEPDPDVERALEAKSSLQDAIEILVRGLWWYDFESLVDLIFSRSGWQRVSSLGKTTKDIDMEIVIPVTNYRACVQVKSSANAKTVKDSYESLSAYKKFDKIFFVYHSARGALSDVDIDDSTFELWDCEKVAEQVIANGLVDWLIDKRS
jgi:hypothetical protein